MRQKYRRFFNICLALTVASVVIVLSDTVFFQRIELVALDMFYRLRPPRPPRKDIVIVEITNKDIHEIGRWPWERLWLARMTEALNTFGVRDILFDFLISSRGNRRDDLLLQRSIRDAGNVYLPTFLGHSEKGVIEVLKPLERLPEYAKGTGFANILPDVDGVLRRYQLYFPRADRIYFNVVMGMVMDYFGMKDVSIRTDQMALSNDGRELHIPLVNTNKLLINWYGEWKTSFKRFSFLDVIQAYKDVSAGRRPHIDVQSFKNSIVLVATTATGLYDIKGVPVDKEYPGVGIVATALSNILDQDFITLTPLWLNVLLFYLIALIPAFLVEIESMITKTGLILVSALAIFWIEYQVFLQGYKMPLSTPFIALVFSYVVITALNFISPAFVSRKIEGHEKDALRLKKENQDLCEYLRKALSQKSDLEKINEELDRFVHTVGHDIRSPLLCITGYADMLQHKIKDNLSGKDKELLDGIFNGIDNLNDMLNDLVQRSKKDKGSRVYEEVDFNELVGMIRKRLDFIIRDSHAEMDVQADLPRIVCDRTKISEVLHNLIVNATKFSSRKTDRPRIEIRYKEKDDVHEFMVKDNGIGIDPRYHKEIFEIYKQIAPSDQGQGWGVGLSIVKSFVEDHGGKVRLESHPGEGAAFFFTIPKGLQQAS